MSRDVVVTGLGVVTPLGNCLEESLKGFNLGESALRRVAAGTFGLDREFEIAEVKGFEARTFFRLPKALKLTTRKTCLAVAAARMALDDSGLDGDCPQFHAEAQRRREGAKGECPQFEPESVGVVVGTCGTDMEPLEFNRALGSGFANGASEVAEFGRRILCNLNPLWLIVKLPNMLSAHVAIQMGLCGPNSTLMTDWIAGSEALGEAYRMIQQGEALAVLAGGADSALNPLSLLELADDGLLDNGFAASEGAGFALLEEKQHALERRARIYAEVKGFATASSDLDEREGNAACRVVERVLRQAAWHRQEVSALCPFGIGCRAYDDFEASALQGLGKRELRFKRHIGNAFAASGPIEAALSLGSLGPGHKLLCLDLGFCGQAACLAFETGGDGIGSPAD